MFPNNDSALDQIVFPTTTHLNTTHLNRFVKSFLKVSYDI